MKRILATSAAPSARSCVAITVRGGLCARWKTSLAIVGPGLIVLVGDNDAGAFGTYTQASQDHGTALLWTPRLLISALYVNQEMVLHLGAVSGADLRCRLFRASGVRTLYRRTQ
jgi:Mn2+/Fe2+ NRAMP family transporter